ncbi:hypothetical protein [Streptomyces sasae]|uniref:hypothetical protein n=1 Tax=Streptomyces sasae TaxID=1266772 RepID=UPI00292CDAB6|nr:hypothetical protein [Streptomyces sasae]
MSSPTTRATAIASMFSTALGVPVDDNDPDAVRTEVADTSLRISAPVPASLREAVRLDLLAFLLRTADRFGHSVQHNGASVIWAEVETADAGRAVL